MAPASNSTGDGFDPLVGKRLGKYQVHARLGEGGMGVVYEAEDVYLKRRVALKVLAAAITQDKSARKRFLREARAAASLNSPHIVSIYEVDQHENLIFLVMELFRGTNTQEHLLATGPFDWRVATRIVAAACRGVSAVHARGLIHRDIKPANIMLSQDGLVGLSAAGPSLATSETVKLADFGLAKCVSGEQSPMTSANVVMGTPVYMSPEQCRAEPLDVRSDVYSLGATYFALLTGRPPFMAEQPMQVMFAHCSSPVPDARTLVPQVSPGCQKVVERAMSKEPSRRYQSVDELLADLLALLGEPGPASVESPPMASAPVEPLAPATTAYGRITVTSVPAREKRKSDKLRIIAGVGVALVLALAAGLGYAGYLAATRKSSANKGGPAIVAPKEFQIRPGERLAPGQVQSLAISQNGELLAEGVIGTPGTVYVRDLRADAVLPHVLTGDRDDSYVRTLAFVPRTEFLAVALGSRVWLFEPRTGKQWSIVNLSNAGISTIAISPHGDSLLVAEQSWGSEKPRLWEYELREQAGRLAALSPRVILAQSGAIKSIALSPDGKYVASLDKTSNLQFGPIRGDTFESRPLPRHDSQTEYTHSVVYSSDGKLLASVADRRVVVWNVPELTEVRQFDVEPQATNIVLAFVPGSRVLASGSTAGVKFWNSETGEPAGRANADRSGIEVSGLVFFPWGDMLITGGRDKRVAIRNWKEAAGIMP